MKSGGLRELRAAFRDGTPPLGPDAHGYPLLHWAAMRKDGGFRTAGWLLDAGADPNQIDRARFRQTALHLAAEAADLELAELLMDRGAQPDLPDAWGNGPAWKALHFGALDINDAKRPRFERMVRLLVARGADLDRLNHAERSARSQLRFACWSALADL